MGKRTEQVCAPHVGVVLFRPLQGRRGRGPPNSCYDQTSEKHATVDIFKPSLCYQVMSRHSQVSPGVRKRLSDGTSVFSGAPVALFGGLVAKKSPSCKPRLLSGNTTRQLEALFSGSESSELSFSLSERPSVCRHHLETTCGRGSSAQTLGSGDMGKPETMLSPAIEAVRPVPTQPSGRAPFAHLVMYGFTVYRVYVLDHSHPFTL